MPGTCGSVAGGPSFEWNRTGSRAPRTQSTAGAKRGPRLQGAGPRRGTRKGSCPQRRLKGAPRFGCAAVEKGACALACGGPQWARFGVGLLRGFEPWGVILGGLVIEKPRNQITTGISHRGMQHHWKVGKHVDGSTPNWHLSNYSIPALGISSSVSVVFPFTTHSLSSKVCIRNSQNKTYQKNGS